MNIVQCVHCGADIVWCWNSRTGRMAPIRYDPDPGGMVIICAGGYSPLFVRLTRRAAEQVNPLIRRVEHHCRERVWRKGMVA